MTMIRIMKTEKMRRRAEDTMETRKWEKGGKRKGVKKQRERERAKSRSVEGRSKKAKEAGKREK